MEKFLTIMFVVAVAFETLADTVKFAVKVLDEQTGLPVPGVKVSAGFTTDRGLLARDRYTCEFKQYETDADGLIAARGTSNCGEAGWSVNRAEGYYCPVHGNGTPRFHGKNLFGVWQPDNTVITVKLQRVEHPIPLLVKRTPGGAFDSCKEDLFSKGNGRIMFDFIEGDWLPPVGHGKVADVEFVRLPHQSFGEVVGASGVKGESYRNSMSVKFLGEGNGLVEMHPFPEQALKIRLAPASGYSPDYLCWKGEDAKLKWETNYDENRCFCFRIRTRRNEDGTIKEAYYGKIYGDFKISHTSDPFVPVAAVWMRYYLNPISLDRNLEWDRVNNLCPNPGDVGHSVGERQP